MLFGVPGRQLVLRYPSFPEGMTSRALPELGRGIIAGKNAYRIQFDDPEKAPWGEVLMEILQRIRSHEAD